MRQKLRTSADRLPVVKDAAHSLADRRIESNAVNAGNASLRAVASATTAAASGCSLARSTLASAWIGPWVSNAYVACTMSTRGRPSMSVPVLSRVSRLIHGHGDLNEKSNVRTTTDGHGVLRC